MPDQSKQSNSSKIVHLEPENQRIIRIKLSKLPPVAQSVHEKGKALAFKLLRGFFDRADDALFELADKAQSNQEQNLYFDAMREVRIQRRSIEKGFGDTIDCAFADLVLLDRPSTTYQDDNISVVLDDELTTFISVDSSVARANRDFGESIQLLCTRLHGLFAVRLTGLNFPLAPHIICQAFLAEEKKLNVGIKSKLVLFKLFEKSVVNKLGEVYAPLNVFLKAQPTPSLTLGTESPLADIQNENHPTSAIDLALSAEVISILNEMVDENNAAVSGTANKVSYSAEELLKVLTDAQKIVQSQSDADVVDVHLAIAAWQKQTKRAPSTKQVDDQVINLVEMLFEFVLDGQDLAPPMHALISRMQIPIVKAAIVDKGFFTEAGHVARKLLNDMATTALAWEGDEQSCQNDPLFLKMQAIVQRLNEEFVSDLAIFSEVLADFTDFTDGEKKRSAVLEQRTIDAEGGKARAEVARTTVAVEIELRTQGKHLPEVMNTLIHDAWSKVLFVSVLKHGYDSEEWVSNLAVLDDLIWSMSPPEDLSQRQKLIKLVPNLLRQLRCGLDSISYNPFAMSDIFKALEKVHLACLRGKAEKPKAPETRPTPAAPSLAADTKPPANSGLADQSREMEKAVQTPVNLPPAPLSDLDKIDADLAKHKALEPELRVAQEALKPDDVFMRQVDSFVQGAWFEMMDENGVNMRCRLAVYLKPTGKYIFVNRSGMKIAEKTQLELALALRNNQLRALDNSMLFDRALETIVTSLRKN